MSLIHAIIKTKIFILQVRENTERFRKANNQTKTIWRDKVGIVGISTRFTYNTDLGIITTGCLKWLWFTC